MERQPAFYIPHGAGPCFFMDWEPADAWVSVGDWLQGFAAMLPKSPQALLFVSAHWEGPQFTLNVNEAPGLFYDYYGFPPHTYELTWPVKPASWLFPKVETQLEASGLPFAHDHQRGFDHGVFIPGKVMFPKADIPVLQISIRKDLDPVDHLRLGRALAPLRDEGVLVIGSGLNFHNMQEFRWADNELVPGADLFDAWLTETIQLEDRRVREDHLIHWMSAPMAKFCHPREDHLVPLFVIAGTAGEQPGRLVYQGRAMGAPLAAYMFP